MMPNSGQPSNTKLSSSTDIESENRVLANKYRPLLVLFPEIKDGSLRQDHHNTEHDIAGVPPLDYDYHPRDIRFILDNARLPPTGVSKLLCYLGIRKEKPSRESLLDAMSKNVIKHIDLLDERGPKDVDKFWDAYAGIRDKNSNPEYQRKTYARVVRGSAMFQDYISIQYWLAYFFDDWANVHEMDWEMVSVILKGTAQKEKPIACVYNAHIGSFRKPWNDVQKVGDGGNINPSGLHPVAYIANGSHASYFSDYPPAFNVAEKYVKSMLKTVIRLTATGRGIGADFTDFVPNFEEGEGIFPEVDVIPEPDKNGHWSGDWRWLNFKGHWGSPAELTIKERLVPNIPLLRALVKIFERPIRESGPTGPNARPGLCWDSPFSWINMECLDAEGSRNWLAEM